MAAGKSPTTDDRDKELLPLIRAGNKSAIDEFVDGMLALTICIAGQYARNNRRESDELVSTGLLGLARALNELDRMPDDNLKGFCIPRIHSACANYMSFKFNMRESFGPSDYRTRVKDGLVYKQVELNDSLTPIPKHGYTMQDVLEVVDKLDDREKVVFEMLREGWELKDIASELGQSYKRIYRIWQVAKAKIIRALEDA